MALTRYEYPRTTRLVNMRFNLIQKIRMNVRSDWKFCVYDQGDKTYICANPPFDVTEKANLDAVMTDPSTVEDPPVHPVGETLVVKDIFEYKGDAPFEVAVFFAQSIPGTPPSDQIHIIGWSSIIGAQRLLTAPLKNQLVSWVDDLIVGWE